MFGSQFGLVSGIKKTGARAAIATGLAIMAIIGADSSTYTRADTVSGATTTPPRTGWMQKFEPATAPAALPTSAFTEQDGAKRVLADFGGQIVLMNFWATWCGPCVREMPSLERLHQKLGSKDFTVIALSEDRKGWDKITPFRKQLGLTALPLFHDVGSKMMFGAKVGGLPTTILIGRDGKELGRLTGHAEWDSDEAVALLQHYIAKR
ncbi:MAG: thiol-disulfide isomerase/thioredoxin [Paracoccaceae bacterium]|jgi:thiol-disulfide isomerase/thioredoxin